jgi:hypothetical protein
MLTIKDARYRMPTMSQNLPGQVVRRWGIHIPVVGDLPRSKRLKSHTEVVVICSWGEDGSPHLSSPVTLSVSPDGQVRLSDQERTYTGQEINTMLDPYYRQELYRAGSPIPTEPHGRGSFSVEYVPPTLPQRSRR